MSEVSASQVAPSPGALEGNESEKPSHGAEIRAVGISKRYGHTLALNDVSLTIEPGQVHALVGENGAGKSTLGKVIAGAITADAGKIIVDGVERSYRSPRDALADGITIIDQEFALLWSHSVLENVFLGQARKSHTTRLKEFAALQARVGFSLGPNRIVSTLRVAEQQQVEILRAVSRRSRVIVMDEPTAALSQPEIKSLLRLVKNLSTEGVSIIYVSHALEEVLEVAHAITVLRDGALVWTREAADQTKDTLVNGMLGRSLDAAFPDRREAAADAPVRLAVKGLSRPGLLWDIDLDVRAGEILGIAGLVGSGRSELAHALFGADACSGEMWLDGEQWRPSSPRASLAAGVSLLPESRKEQGLMLQNSLAYNVTLPVLPSLTVGGVINGRKKSDAATATIDSLDIRPPDGRIRVGALSGGNQQKALFGRCLATEPRVLIVDEPTRGVDVGAKRAIYDLLVSLASNGCAIILISSEIEELRGLAHRFAVINSGRIVTELAASASEEELLQAMFASPLGARADEQRRPASV